AVVKADEPGPRSRKRRSRSRCRRSETQIAGSALWSTGGRRVVLSAQGGDRELIVRALRECLSTHGSVTARLRPRPRLPCRGSPHLVPDVAYLAQQLLAL